MAKPPKHVNLTDLLNPWYLDEDGVVFMHQSGVEIGFQVWLPEASSCTEADVDMLETTYRNMLDGTGINKGRVRVMTFHRPATLDEVQEMPFPTMHDPMQRALVDQEQAAILERAGNGEYMMHETFVFIHIPESRPGVSRSDNRSYNNDEHAAVMLQANTERERLMSALNNMGLPTSPLINEDPYYLMWRWYNIGQISEVPPRYDWDYELPTETRQEIRMDPSIRPRTLRSQVVNSDLIAERFEYLQNGDAKIVVSDLTNYGKEGFVGMTDKCLARLSNYTYVHVVDISFTNESNIKNRIERQIASAEKQAEQGGRREDVAKAGNMSQAAMQAYQNGGRFVRFGMSMVVVCDTDAEVQKIRNHIRNDWNNEGRHQMSSGNYSNWAQFVQHLAPYSGMTTDYLLDQQVSNLPFFLPFYGPWYNSGGVTLGIFENDYGGQQRITLPNTSDGASHMAVFGSTRGGKSFTIQKLLMNLYMLGDSLRIMDIKNDYEPLAAWLKGQFIPCYPGAQFEQETTGPHGQKQPAGTRVSYNIFEGRLPTDTSPALDDNDRRDIIAFLKTMIAEPLNKEENAILSSAVFQFTEVHHELVATSTGPVRTYKGALLGNFVEALYSLDRTGEFGLSTEERQIARRLARLFQPYTQGVYAQLFNAPSTLNPTNRVTVFDLSQLGEGDPLIGLFMILINKATWDAARKRKDKRSRIVLLSEETGVTGKIPEVEALLEHVVLSGAAYNLMLIVVAQEYEHIEALGGLLNNITRIIMTRSTPAAAAKIAELLRMNDEQEKTLGSLVRVNGKYNELLVREAKPDGTYQIGKIRYRPTDLEYSLFSSDAADKTRRTEIMEASGGDMTYAVRRLIEERQQAQTVRR